VLRSCASLVRSRAFVPQWCVYVWCVCGVRLLRLPRGTLAVRESAVAGCVLANVVKATEQRPSTARRCRSYCPNTSVDLMRTGGVSLSAGLCRRELVPPQAGPDFRRGTSLRLGGSSASSDDRGTGFIRSGMAGRSYVAAQGLRNIRCAPNEAGYQQSAQELAAQELVTRRLFANPSVAFLGRVLWGDMAGEKRAGLVVESWLSGLD
jgi:hypothetical protein